MENASKALIMVGGVLITVMVISLTMYLFTNARGVANASERRLKTSQIEAFNRFFINYPAEITGLDAYNIIAKIRDIQIDTHSLGWVSANLSSVSDATEDFKNDRYNYEYFDTDGDGLIDSVILSHI